MLLRTKWKRKYEDISFSIHPKQYVLRAKTLIDIEVII